MSKKHNNRSSTPPRRFESERSAKKPDKKWRDHQPPVVDTDIMLLQRELLGIELCVSCQHTYPRDLSECPSCGRSSS